jgi:hypothetical protein
MEYRKIYLSCLFGVIIVLLACNQQQPAATAGATEQVAAPGLRFVFSDLAPTQGAQSNNNWCRMPLPEAAVINADPANNNRRLFTLADGPHRVTISFGNIVASFVLLKKGDSIEVFTSDNYPECLSNRNNFSMLVHGQGFHYDNQKHIIFDVSAIKLANGTQIALDIDIQAGYGIVVRR